jgi:hypothetical protein
LKVSALDGSRFPDGYCPCGFTYLQKRPHKNILPFGRADSLFAKINKLLKISILYFFRLKICHKNLNKRLKNGQFV